MTLSIEYRLPPAVAETDEDSPFAGVVNEAAREHAANEARDFIVATWKSAVSGALLPGMSRVVTSRSYADSIKGEVIFGDRIVVTSDYPYADQIQHGRAKWDMKPSLLAGGKARRGKQGQRYTVIPFSHRTPGRGTSTFLGPLPGDVYRLALRGVRIPAAGEMGQRGLRTKIGPPNPYTWTTGSYAGLKRYGHGANRRGYYFTFRAVSENSAPNSWWYPAIPANDVRGAVEDFTRQHMGEVLRGDTVQSLGLPPS